MAGKTIEQGSERYALLSASDKTGIVDFARTLTHAGYKIISTGGTAETLRRENIDVIPIQEITGNPESFDGRMKTISFQIESGILFDRTNPAHQQEAQALHIPQIDVVACNLYPFEQTISNPHATEDQIIENIDVGGPTMVRSAAKNHKNVLVVVDPKDYEAVGHAIASQTVTPQMRRSLAARAFNHLSFYDGQVAGHLQNEQFPQEIGLPFRRAMSLRYGENPHQHAALYFEPNTNSPLQKLQRLTGRELSYVNVTDIAAGLESIRVFTEPAAVVIKHNSPSGIAVGQTLAEALKRAVAADPESAFGGVIVLNKPLDKETAEAFASFKEENGVVVDIVASPEITDDAKAFIKKVRKTTGIYTFGAIPDHRSNPTHLRFFDGGVLMQEWDDTEPKFSDWKVVTEKKPTEEQQRQMEIAWKFISRIRSNSILVMDRDLPMTRGIGSGQTSRVRAVRIALEQAGDHAKGAILASDSFFPFDDSVKLAAAHGITAIIQQGGSVNDNASIDAANAAGIAMVMTGERKFWH